MAKPRREERVREFARFLREERLPVVEAEWSARTHGAGGESVSIELHIPTQKATSAGLTLYDVDREVRRAASLLPAVRGPVDLADDVEARRAFRPITTGSGGLEIREARPGSLNFTLQAYGSIEHFLLSDPVAAVLVLKELLGWGGRISAWVRRPGMHKPEPLPIDDSPPQDPTLVSRPYSMREIPSASMRITHMTTQGDETIIELFRD